MTDSASLAVFDSTGISTGIHTGADAETTEMQSSGEYQMPDEAVTGILPCADGASNHRKAWKNERALWKQCLRNAESGKLEPVDVIKLIQNRNIDILNANISRSDCGDLVLTFVETWRKQRNAKANQPGEYDHETQTLSSRGKDGMLEGFDKLVALADGILRVSLFFFEKKYLELRQDGLETFSSFVLQELDRRVSAGEDCQGLLKTLSFLLFQYCDRLRNIHDDLFVKLFELMKIYLSQSRNFDQICEAPIDREIVLIENASLVMSCLGTMVQRKTFENCDLQPFFALATTELVFLQRRYFDISASIQRKEELTSQSSREASHFFSFFTKNLKLLTSVYRSLHGIVLCSDWNCLPSQVATLVDSVSDILRHEYRPKDGTEKITNKVPHLGENLSCPSYLTSPVGTKTRSRVLLKMKEKLAFFALELLKSLCEKQSRAMQAHWEDLIPQNVDHKDRNMTPMLLHLAVYDYRPKIRGSAYDVISALLETSKVRPWLLQSSKVVCSRISFVPFGVKIVRMVEVLHRDLAKALIEENTTSVRTRVLYCTGVLFRAIPYSANPENERMLVHFFSTKENSFSAMKFVLSIALQTFDDGFSGTKVQLCRDYREEAVTCISLLLRSEKQGTETVRRFVLDILLPGIFEAPHNGTGGLDKMSALTLQARLRLLGDSLTKYAASVLEWCDCFESQFGALVRLGFSSSWPSSREGAIRVMIQIYKLEFVQKVIDRSELVYILKDLLRALGDIDSGVRLCAATCLVDIPAYIWDAVGVDERKVCIERIVGSMTTPLNSVPMRQASLMGLGSIALCSSFRYDDSFSSLAIPVLCAAIDDDEVVIRSRAAIAIANCVSWYSVRSSRSIPVEPATCEAEREEAEAIARHYNNTAKRLLVAVLSHDEDHDKVLAPCVRAMGFLFSVLYRTELNLGKQALAVLDTSASSDAYHPKVRVSACNAIGDILYTVGRKLDFEERQSMLGILLSCATQSSSFRVRIAALSALMKAVECIPAPTRHTMHRDVAAESVQLLLRREGDFLTKTEQVHIDKCLSLLKGFANSLIVERDDNVSKKHT